MALKTPGEAPALPGKWDFPGTEGKFGTVGFLGIFRPLLPGFGVLGSCSAPPPPAAPAPIFGMDEL